MKPLAIRSITVAGRVPARNSSNAAASARASCPAIVGTPAPPPWQPEQLAAPGGVFGLLSRGVTLVGQSEAGTIQVIATDTAPLGRHGFLRLEAVGTVEDQPVYRGSRFLELEIVE